LAQPPAVVMGPGSEAGMTRRVVALRIHIFKRPTILLPSPPAVSGGEGSTLCIGSRFSLYIVVASASAATNPQDSPVNRG
jgi:hypothetical protein